MEELIRPYSKSNVRAFFITLILALPVTAAPLADEAFQKMYNSDFTGAIATASRYVETAPQDPFAYAVLQSAWLFRELDRMNLLESEFFESDHHISSNRSKIKPDPVTRQSFYAALEKSQALSQAALDKDPKDTQALFALSMSLGCQVDYMALVEKRQLASLSVNKRAYREAKRLIAIDPSFTDAYLTTGFTEYLVGSLPMVVRWFVKFDDVQGSKDQAFRTLEKVARQGHYLKPLAKILMAAGYLREKKPAQAETLLADLVHDYPANSLLKREHEKLRPH
jgi:hypothetical protein